MKKNFKNLIIIVISFVVLFYVLAPSLSQKAPAQGRPPIRGGPPQSVTVVNQPSDPVPIQGDVEVTNQLDVSVTNTATVEVVNTDPVPIQGDVEVTNQLDVSVTNTPTVEVVNTDPVPVRVTNESAFQPWRVFFNLELGEGEVSRMVQFPDIPAGKRLVIESVTAQLLVLKEQIPYISLSTDGFWYNVALSNIGSYAPAQNVWMATHALKLYAEDYGWVRCARAGGGLSPFFATLSLSGYLVDLP